MSQNITATVEPKGSKFLHRVFLDGREVATRTSAKMYGWVQIQRWAQVGEDKPMNWPVGANAGDPEQFAPRFASKPGPVGGKIEYGFRSQNVVIVEGVTR